MDEQGRADNAPPGHDKRVEPASPATAGPEPAPIVPDEPEEAERLAGPPFVPPRLPDALLACALSLISGCVYVLTLAPGVVAGNSGEYQYIPYILSIAHSTGYPLYTLIGKAFTLLPIGTVAYRMNLLSAVAAALAVGLVYCVVRRLIDRQALAAVAALLFAFGSSFWAAALIAEVHALNVAFVALALYLLLRWADRQEALGAAGVAWRDLRWFALAYGLSLTHHRTTLLLAPAFALFVALMLWRRRGKPRMDTDGLETGAAQRQRPHPRASLARELGLTVLIFLLPLLVYAYIPLRGEHFLSSSDPAVTAVYQDRVPEAILRGTVTAHYRQSLSGFLNLVTGSDYAVDVGLESWDQLVERLVLWATTLVTQVSPIGVLLGLIGAVALWVRHPRRAALFSLGYASLVGFALVYVGHGQIWYYFMPSYVFMAGFVGVALSAIWDLLENRPKSPESPVQPVRFRTYAMYAALWLLVPLVMAQNNWSRVDMSRHTVDQSRAQDALAQPLEQGAVVMGPWDLVTPVRYYQYAEGVRPDLVVVHGDPAYSSGQKIIKQARALRRPLYLLGLPPLGDQVTGPPGSWVQLTPLPYYGPVDAGGPAAEFGGKVALLGTRVPPVPIRLDRTLGTPLHVRAYWRSLADLKRDYRVLLRLVSPEGLTVAEIDESPASVYYPSSRWQSGEVYRGDHWLELPPYLPAGSYSLELALIDQESGERLPLTSAPPAGDAVRVEGVVVE